MPSGFESIVMPYKLVLPISVRVGQAASFGSIIYNELQEAMPSVFESIDMPYKLVSEELAFSAMFYYLANYSPGIFSGLVLYFGKVVVHYNESLREVIYVPAAAKIQCSDTLYNILYFELLFI